MNPRARCGGCWMLAAGSFALAPPDCLDAGVRVGWAQQLGSGVTSK